MKRLFGLALCLSILCWLVFIPARADAAPIPEQEKKPFAAGQGETPTAAEQAQKEAEMGKMFEQMGPAMGTMMESMMGAMFRFLAKPEVADNLATFTKNYYEALIAKGFSKEEALKIVVSVGVPQAGK